MIQNCIHADHPLVQFLPDEYDFLLTDGDLSPLPAASAETLRANLETLVDGVVDSFDMTLAEYLTTQMTNEDIWSSNEQHPKWVAEGVTFADLARRSLSGKVAARWTTDEMVEIVAENSERDAAKVRASLTDIASQLGASPAGPWYYIADPHFFLEDAGLVALVHDEHPETIAAWYTCAGINF